MEEIESIESLARQEYEGCTIDVYRSGQIASGPLFAYRLTWTTPGGTFADRLGSWGSIEAAMQCGISHARTRKEVHNDYFGPAVERPLDVMTAILDESRRTSGRCHYCGLPVGPRGCEECV